MKTKGKPTEAKKTGEPGWKWRRLIIFPVVTWACWQLMKLIDAPDTRVNETVAWIWGVMIMVLVLGYTGFATVQDIIAIWRTGTGLPYATPPVAVDGDPVDRACPEPYEPPPQPFNAKDEGRP
ncbi:hypothetical protein [Rhizobium sp. 2MFCol3.1]|uniref:hypothetical protein n=1 Tax=Rhizobium sp. 2MFCol3.1 TaxID=1246459 RepID=UPI0003715341|nr:hypothetical protein [Rhizobium sp. 2MFCol3.1]